MTKIVIVILIVGWSIFLPGLSNAQEDSNRLYKIGRTLFELQQQFLEHQEVFDKKSKEWKAQREEFQLLVEKLTKENQALKDQLTDLKKQLEVFEEKLETSETAKLSRELQDVNAVLRSLILTTLYEEPQAEELILKLVNSAVSSLPRDLLILYLANQKRQQGKLEQSLGYYGTLASQFPESRYLSRSIYEMSEVFGKLGKKDEQKTLLLQLTFIQEANPYAIKAKEKLRELQLSAGESSRLSETISDTTADISQDAKLEDTHETDRPVQKPREKTFNSSEQNLDSTADAAVDSTSDVSIDSTSDTVSHNTADATSDESVEPISEN